MEKLKKGRKTMRSSVSKLIATMANLENPVELQAKMVALENLRDRLSIVNDEIMDLMLDEPDNDKECEDELEKCQEISVKIEAARIKAQIKLDGVHSEGGSISEGNCSEGSRTKIFRYPKLQLESFDLDCRSWLAFWAQYKRIYEDPKLDFNEKFQYLMMSLKPGNAKDMVNSHPRDEANFVKVVEALKNRFGRETMLIEIYTRELISIVLSPDSCKSVSKLYDKIMTQLRALEGLGMTSEKCAFVLYPLVESCLPAELLKEWERQRRRTEVSDRRSVSHADSDVDKDFNPLDELMEFLAEEVRSEERINLAHGLAPTKVDEVVPSHTTAAALVSTDTFKARDAVKIRKDACIFCEKEHASHDCFKAQGMSRDERDQHIAKKGACFRCLKRGHRVNQCKASVRCMLCSRQHFVLMCHNRDDAKLSRKVKEKDVPSKSSSSTKGNGTEEKTHANFSGIKSLTYLKTLQVKIKGRNGTMTVRALLDDGAQRSYVTRDVVEQIGLTPQREEFISHGLFGGQNGPSKNYNIYQLQVQSMKGNVTENVTAVETEAICHDLERPSPLREPGLFAALAEKGISLSDVGDNPPPVKILLGADTLGRILTGSMHVLPNGVTAVNTKLGWTILGTSSRKAKTVVTMCLNANCIPQNMWELEYLGISEPVMPPGKGATDDDVRAQFSSTIKKEQGRYVVNLPWIAGHPPLQDNLSLAQMRLENVTAKLKRDGNYDAYEEIFLSWEREGIIEMVRDGNPERVHYLPHRPVIKESSQSTKIRPVFDASAKRVGSASLNDCLHKGANMLQLIPTLLLKFRMGKYGVSSDIKQAFLQLSVQEKDRDVLRFLWWGADGEMCVYRHCRVVFGVTSSPYLLNATISHHLTQEIENIDSQEERCMIAKLKDSFYVDDSVESFDSRSDLDLFAKTAKATMQRGSFELRRWTSNAWQEDNEQEAMVLGLKWDLKNDLLCCANVGSHLTTKKITKRSLLGLVNAVYDPIGMLSPALLTARIMLQEAWQSNVDWDDPLPEELQKRFLAWATHLSEIENIQIPRHLCTGKIDVGTTTVHVFSDASQKGYGCCIFVRNATQDGYVSLQLVAAKARVAPLQSQTIPRMELLGACLGVRLFRSMEPILGGLKVTFWTDSMTVLAWVSKALTWGTFVGNRIREIRNGSNVNDWRFVPGIQNPADVASRGCNMKELLELKWWEGPSWLKEDGSTWPQSPIECTEEALTEVKCKGTNHALTTLQGNSYEDYTPFSDVLTRYFSSYLKMLRMVAFILRFLHRVKTAEPLRSEEIIEAEKKIIAVMQREGDCEVQGVETHVDNGGLIRVTSRVVDKERATSLAVLPSGHKIVSLLIRQVHEDLLHAGVGTTLAKLREKFWLKRGRREVRKVLAGCVTCRKLTAKKCIPPPAALPVERTSVKATAFQVSGMDLFGPLYLKDGSKVWGILFTCAVYRAVRLDIVDSLSTECFVRALRRFLARNNCSELISDQGTNFMGLANQLQAIDWTQIADFATKRRLKMVQIPPASPWYGGFYERLVGVVKMCLRKQVGAASLTLDELQTLFVECEAVVNARPLTYVSDDVLDFRAITPAHFLQEAPADGTCEIDELDSRSLIRRVQYVQNVRQQLRERFVREYLSLLVQRGNLGKCQAVAVGDVVLVEAQNVKRQFWPLGRVTEIFPGKDGQCRVARLKTQQGELIRPFQRLYKLEVSTLQKETQSEMVRFNKQSDSTEVDQSYSANDKQQSYSANDEQQSYSANDEQQSYSANDEHSDFVCNKRTKIGRVIKVPKKLDL